MAKAATYTEEDLRQAFLCGVKHGQENPKGDPAAVSENWIDCLFYWGFHSETLFNRPGYSTKKLENGATLSYPSKPKGAKAGK